MIALQCHVLSAVQCSESVTCTRVLLFRFPFCLGHHSPLCYTAGSH